MKKLTIFTLLSLALTSHLQAQEQGKFRIGWDLGITVPQDGIGASYSVEPKYNITDNMSVGIKTGLSADNKEINFDNAILNNFDWKYENNLSRYFIAIFDYYTPKKKGLTPFVGGGVGVFNIDGIEVTSEGLPENINYTFENNTEFAFLTRGGFEYGKFKFGVEYFFIPETSIKDEGDDIGTASNQFLNVSVGFYLGGGKW